MLSLPRKSHAARVLLVLSLCSVAAGAGCGRMLIGRLAPDAPDGGADLAPDRGADGGADLAPDISPPVDAPPVATDLPEVCTSDAWCWTHPLPTSDRFVTAFWVGADDLWLGLRSRPPRRRATAR
jgi:hypothetical protein